MKTAYLPSSLAVSLRDSRIRLFCVLLLLQLSFAQEASFRITPLRPVAELRAEALKAQPPREQGRFRTRSWWSW